MTARHPIKPTSPRCPSAWQPNPGGGSTYRSGKSVQTTGTTSVPPLFPRAEIDQSYAELKDAQRSLDVEVYIVEAGEGERIAEALAEIAAEKPDALLLTSGLALSSRVLATQFALTNRLPTITDTIWPNSVDPYPFMSYGSRYRRIGAKLSLVH